MQRIQQLISFIIGIGVIALGVFFKRKRKWYSIPVLAVALFVGGFFLFRSTQPEPFAFAAEVTIDSAILDATDQRGSPTIVFVSDTNGYVFYVDSNGHIVYKKTTDSGATWDTTPTDVDGGTDNCNVVVWYDQWTPGDTSGTKIYIAWMDIGADDVWVRTLDTSDDTFDSAAVAAIDGTTFSCTGLSISPTITKATDGDLFVTNTAGSNVDVASSTDSGANWADENISFLEADITRLVPLASGDVLLIYADVSANNLLSRVYDDSAATSFDASDTTILAGYGEGSISECDCISASVYKADNTVYLMATHEPQGSTGDIIVYKYDGSWTDLGNLTTNKADQFGVAIMVDDNNGDLYAMITDEVSNGQVDVLSLVSTNGGTSWTSTTTVNATRDDIRNVLSGGSSDERIYAVWNNDDLNDILGNTVADLTPPEGGARRIIKVD